MVGGTLLTLAGCDLSVKSVGTTRKHALPMPGGCTFGKTKPGGPAQVKRPQEGRPYWS